MFARLVHMRLKMNCVAQLTHKIETEVVPMLRGLKGFQDEITFVTQSGTEALAISLWDRAENAGIYHRTLYPSVIEIVSQYIDGTPQLQTLDVTTSTFHKIIPTGLV